MKSEQPKGATPLDDYSGLKTSWVQTREQLDLVEAENIQSILRKYLGARKYPFPRWFTVVHFNQVHREMFGKVWTWAGKYRKTIKSIGIAPYKIIVEMKQLEEDSHYWGNNNEFSAIEIAARIHHRLVWIHPYENGNGRHARLIGDMVLSSLKHSYPLWPTLNENGEERERYLHALREADRHNFHPLEKLLQFFGDR